jgi:DNA-binding MarR family transcriptional regulator
MTYHQTMAVGFDLIKLMNDNEKKLTSSQMRVLIFLYVKRRYVELGTLVSECGLARGQHRSTGGSIVASLEKDGLITIMRNPKSIKNSSRTHIHISIGGMKIVETVAREMRENIFPLHGFTC